jgi:hypothetical protein
MSIEASLRIQATPDVEQTLLKLKRFLAENGLGFYTLAERYEGKQKYVDIEISVKLS